MLHDEVGSALSSAGLHLHLLGLDFPDTADRVQQIADQLDHAMERVRALSQELDPSPVRRSGLKSALEALVESARQKFAGKISLAFANPPQLPLQVADPLYAVAKAALFAAMDHTGATRIEVSFQGTSNVISSIRDNGRARPQSLDLELASLQAHLAGLSVDVSSGKGTIVKIRHGL